MDKALGWLLGRALRACEDILLLKLFTPVTTCGPCDCPDTASLRDACLTGSLPRPGEVVLDAQVLVHLALGVACGGLWLGLLLGAGACWLARSSPAPPVGWAPAAPPSPAPSEASRRGPTSPSALGWRGA